ncbi:type II secretion system F family protein [Niveibacterium umoris]|uniref:General secretion pathway protein F n=1 Tax=Niveibacterium umoris TaxID=1193620 RepID=A0A840BRT2_9RHOO|nr:type II secretion system F family protein [Niveibacterium umoris]MBB4013526.1 general secretion pathway protein F [Niveibacterium umoris]
MRFEVRALSAEQVETLVVDALDEGEARRLVAARQMTALSVSRAAKKRGSRFDIALFAQELIELLDAGLELAEAIEALDARGGAGESQRVTRALLARLREGQSFSQALAAADEDFPPLFIGLVRAAERTSHLQDALARYLEYRNRFDALKQRIGGALIYPAVLAGVGGAVSLFLLGYVVPKFATVYRGSAHKLPWLSQQMLDLGSFVAANAGAVGLGLAVLLVGGGLALRSAWQQGRVESALRRLPWLGPHVELFRIAQLYLALGTLLNGGLPALQALTLAEGVATPAMLPRLRTVGGGLRRGEAVTDALGAAELVTPVALRLLRAGERSGRLGEMFIRAARHHDAELGRWIDRFSRLFEPLLMAAIGITVGVIVVLLYLPIFDLAGSLQ